MEDVDVVTATMVTPRALGPVTGIECHVALGYFPTGSTVARWDVALWDTAPAVWTGDPPLTDISCNVLSVRIQSGRDLPLERFRPASASVVVDDPDGLYSAWWTSSDPSAYPTIRPGIWLVVYGQIGSTTYPRFWGLVDSIIETFPDTGDRHEITFNAFDRLSILAAFDGLEQKEQGRGDLPGARLDRIVTNASYPYARAFDPGAVALQGTTLAKNAADEMGLVADTELGGLWADRSGVLIFRDRNGISTDAHYTTIQATFGDDETSGANEICYTDIGLASDLDKVKNVVSIANVGGTAVTVSDSASITSYQARTWQRFDLIHQDEAQSTIIANAHLSIYANAAQRIESLTIELGALTLARAGLALTLDVYWLVNVRRRATGFQVVTDVQIQGVVEEIRPGSWSITFKTFAVRALAVIARWDVGRWDVGLWGY